MKLSNYISPLYMAYSYEAKQGPQHNQLAQELIDTSFYLNSTVTTLRHEVQELASAININSITYANANSSGGVTVVFFVVVTKFSGIRHKDDHFDVVYWFNFSY